MNKTLRVLLWAGVAAGETELQAQGTFQNLDFEAARLVFLKWGSPFIATTNALPGWTATLGNQPLTAVPCLPILGQPQRKKLKNVIAFPPRRPKVTRNEH